jgi:[glutamine synthetase] adenylyltransferase / [glutamine synthetase]-adenylyl-L-tyrosine phosphorylase
MINDTIANIRPFLTDKQIQLAQLEQVADMSAFVKSVCDQYPQQMAELVQSGVLQQSERVDWQREAIAACFEQSNINQVKSEMRQCRRMLMTTIAIRDLTSQASLRETLRHLSELANHFIQMTLQWVQDQAKELFGVAYNQQGQVQSLVVLAMGKLGASELNFSSDIDLIFCFDEDGMTQGGRRSVEHQQYFTRIGQQLIQMLADHTADGFVYRVDMRLRPYGDSGALVLSYAAMEEYYQDQGREWERFAMVKARPVTGSEQEQKLISSLLKPFVFRRYIDFGVLEAIRQLKSQVEIEQRRKRHIDNIKLGSGGIREIEFIVQSLQLIRGGREPRLRERHLLSVLPLLAEFEFLAVDEVKQLELSYQFLRKLENCLQALEDQQTQLLPQDGANQASLAHALGYADWSDCYQAYLNHAEHVHRIFAALFSESELEEAESEQSEQSQSAALLWHGGFDAETDISSAVESFKSSKFITKMTERGRRRLDQLMPILLNLIVSDQASKQALQPILDLITAIAKRTAYLELLAENPPMLAHLVDLCAMSKRLASHLQSYPLLLDELLYPKSLYAPPPIESIDSELGCALLRCDPDDSEQVIEGLRQFKLAHELRVAAAELKGVFDIKQVSRYLTQIATSVVSRVVQLAWQEMFDKYGAPFEGATRLKVEGFGVLAYGKVGGKEMGYDSDLDLVYIHNLDTNCQSFVFEPQQKSIEVGRFIMRLAQRIMHLLSIRTASGVLYEVDMRLRPSGNSGLLVSQLDAFVDYQLNEAWTWEHQALTRASLIGGDDSLNEQLISIKQRVYAKTAIQKDLLEQVVQMRIKLRGNKLKANDALFDLKQGIGGMVDIEFICQYLTLKHGSLITELAQESNTIERLRILKRHGYIEESHADILIKAYRDYRTEVNILAHQNMDAKVLLEKTTLNPDNVVKIWQDIMQES